MRDEQREAIDRLKQLKDYSTTYYGSMYFKVEVKADDEMKETIDTVLSLIKEQDKYIKDANDITTEMSNDIKKLTSEIEKKDKQIDLMAEYISKRDVEEDICMKNKTNPDWCNEDYTNCQDCIKKYFADLVEKE